MLYRKWRPGRFADVVGQQAMTRTLEQAVITSRVAHAYLFCGPRGTGKTSTARVLAKAVNCLNRPEGTGEPCGECAVCQAVPQGNFIDLIEIDAASNRGIDEIRSLREKVHFAPTHAAVKVYIIDEAHMLTDAAFNAFLKTLEEPPPRTLFVLCTTEPHKLPATIISRCQRFDFHRITAADIGQQMAHIAQAENAEASPKGLELVARAASGSLRDATNLLDQLLSSQGGSVTEEGVRDLLGLGGEEQAVAMVQHLLSGDTTEALNVINAVAAQGLDLRPLHRMTVDHLRAALLMKSGVDHIAEISDEAKQVLAELVPLVSIERLLRALKLFGQVSLKHDQPSPLPLELAAVELGMEPETLSTSPETRVAQPAITPPTPQSVSPAPRPRPAVPSAPAHSQPMPNSPSQERPAAQTSANGIQATPPPIPAPTGYTGDPQAPPEERLTSQWPAIVRTLSRQRGKRFDIGALLRTSKGHYLDGPVLVVRFSHQSTSERLTSELEEPRCRIAIEEVLAEFLGAPFTVRVETEENRATNRPAQAESHLVRAAINMGGQVVPETREPDPWEEKPDE